MTLPVYLILLDFSLRKSISLHFVFILFPFMPFVYSLDGIKMILQLAYLHFYANRVAQTARLRLDYLSACLSVSDGDVARLEAL